MFCKCTFDNWSNTCNKNFKQRDDVPMINFLSKWIEQIALSVILVSIFELILPNGNLKKYIKVVLGIYIIFCLISPFVNNKDIFNLKNIDIEKYTKKTSKSITNAEKNMDKRLQELYLDELKNDIKRRVEEFGYDIYKCEINANLNSAGSDAGIHKINLIIKEKKENLINVEQVDINTKKNENSYNIQKLNEIKNLIANYYEINADVINIKIK